MEQLDLLTSMGEWASLSNSSITDYCYIYITKNNITIEYIKMYINYRAIKVFDNDILFLYIVYKYILYTNPLFSLTHSHWGY